MLKRLKETNLRTTGVEGYLKENAGPSKDVDKSKTHSLDSLADNKKIFESSRVVLAGQPLQVSKMQLTVEPTFEFTYQLGKETLSAKYKTSQNTFTRMPKGQLSIKVLSSS